MAIELMDGLAGIGYLVRQTCDAALALADLGLTGHRQFDRIPCGGGGKLGVAGYLLGGGGHLGHRGRHHDDLVLLLAHPLAASLGPRRLGPRLGRQFDGDVPQPADDAVQPGHEQVEVLGQQPHLVLAVGRYLYREIPLAMGDGGQRLRHPAEIGEQVVEHGDEQGAEHQQEHQGQSHQLPQQGGKRRFQHLLVHHHGEQPVGTGHSLHREQYLTSVQGGAMQLIAALAPLAEGSGREAGGQLCHRLEGQILVRVTDDEAAAVEQHGVPLPLHLHGQHLVDQRIEGQVGPHGPHQRPLMPHRLGQGNHQFLHGHADVGGGDDQPARLDRILIPGALTGVIVACVEGRILPRHHPLGGTEVGEAKAARGVGLLQVGHQGRLGIVGDDGGQGLDRVLAIRHPVADGHRVGMAIVDRLALDGTHGAGFEGVEGNDAEQGRHQQHYPQAGRQQLAAQRESHDYGSLW